MIEIPRKSLSIWDTLSSDLECDVPDHLCYEVHCMGVWTLLVYRIGVWNKCRFPKEILFHSATRAGYVGYHNETRIRCSIGPRDSSRLDEAASEIKVKGKVPSHNYISIVQFGNFIYRLRLFT